MIQSAAPVTIGSGALTQNLGRLFPNLQAPPAEVKVVNESPNPAIVTIGADQHYLRAYGADVWCLNGAASITIVPQVIATPTPSTLPTSSLLLTVATRPGEIPGVYPSESPTVVTPNVGSGTYHLTSTNNVLVSQTLTIPPGFQGVSYVVSGGALSSFTIVGGTTNGTYLSISSALDNLSGVVAIGPEQTIIVSLTAVGLGTEDAYVTLVPLTATATSALQTDRVQSAGFNVTLAGSGTQSLVTGVSLKRIYCLALNGAAATAVAGAVVLEDADSNQLATLETTITGKFAHPLFGVFGDVGVGVRLRNTGGGAVGQLVGELIYVQK